MKPNEVHRERGQPVSRRNMGFLEKKKDYKKRALDHQRKDAKMKSLRMKARERNPDEFYFKMVNTHLEEGEHVEEEAPPEYTEQQLKLMQTQDERYLNFKRQIERKKIEKLKAGLHFIDAEKSVKSKHTFFVDKKQKNFDVAKHLDTHPLLLSRPSNRPKLSILSTEQQTVKRSESKEHNEMKMTKERAKAYKELEKRMFREEELFITMKKMEVKKSLEEKKRRKFKIKDGTEKSAAAYRFAPKRKR